MSMPERWADQAADASKDMPLEPLGSGSDYSAYLQHLGLETLDYRLWRRRPLHRRLSFPLRHL